MKVAPFPPPFKRLLALNSDVEFTTWPAQIDLLRLFAERGLETAFSYWAFSDPTYTWRLFEADGKWTAEAPAALEMARSGLLDTLHSFGGAGHIHGVAFQRDDIALAYARLGDEGVRTKVYSNHGTDKDVQNIGGPWSPPRIEPIDYRNYWAGDLADHPVYHLDLTLKYGMRYFWLDVDRIRTQAWFQPVVGDGADALFTTQISRDGSPILRFRRTDFNETPWPTNFGAQLTRALCDQGSGYSVVYNHFGFMRSDEDKPVPNPSPYFDATTYEAIDRLVQAQRSGDVLVTSSARLLNFALMQTARPWTIEGSDHLVVTFAGAFEVGGVMLKADWPDFEGFSLELERPIAVELRLGSERREAAVWNEGGKWYAGIPWRPLKTMDLLDDALCRA